VKNRKPDPGVYIQAAKELSLNPNECVAIEDSESGIASATQAGMFTIAVPHAFSIHQDLSGADKLCESFDEINIGLIQGLGK